MLKEVLQSQENYSRWKPVFIQGMKSTDNDKHRDKCNTFSS